MSFQDRSDAGKRLAKELQQYKGAKNTVVVAIPRGGVVIGYEIANALSLPLDVVVTKKIGAPGNPEYAIGSIDTHGNIAYDHDAMQMLGVTEGSLKAEVAKLEEEAKKKLKMMRGDKPPLDVRGKTVIMVDDGIATGYTMQAAIQNMRMSGAEQIVLAVPVSAKDSLERLRKMVDEVVCLSTPSMFMAVGQFYSDFGQTTYDKAKQLMDEVAAAS